MLKDTLRPFQANRPAMGTTAEIYAYAVDEGQAQAVFDVGFDEIDRVDRDLSHYRTSSEVSRINREAASRAVTVDPETFDLLQRCLALSRATGGAFDITVGPLMKAWGFFRDSGRLPDPEELAAAREQTGWQWLELDAVRRTVRFRRPGLEIDLGSIGKGVALDRAARELALLGSGAVLLAIGRSSYRALDPPPGEAGWPIVVRRPFDRSETLTEVRLGRRSLSTSGSAGRFFELEGRRYSHILDPRTGEPANGVAQVTVLAATAARSDALSTALFVLGPEKGAGLLRGPSEAALLVGDAPSEPRVVKLGWPPESTVDTG